MHVDSVMDWICQQIFYAFYTKKTRFIVSLGRNPTYFRPVSKTAVILEQLKYS